MDYRKKFTVSHGQHIMATPVQSVFPSAKIVGTAISIELADFPGLEAGQIEGETSDIRAFSYAFDYQIADGLAQLPAEQKVEGMTKARGTTSNPTPGQRTIPFTSSYTVQDDLQKVSFM
jgi:hypothetical protein